MSATIQVAAPTADLPVADLSAALRMLASTPNLVLEAGVAASVQVLNQGVSCEVAADVLLVRKYCKHRARLRAALRAMTNCLDEAGAL